MTTPTAPAPSRRSRPRLRLHAPDTPEKTARPDRSWTIRQPLACGREVRVHAIASTAEEWPRLPESDDAQWVSLADGDRVIGVKIDG